jgi:hypothetical protein
MNATLKAHMKDALSGLKIMNVDELMYILMADLEKVPLPPIGGLGRRLSLRPPRGSQAGVGMGGNPHPRPEGVCLGGPRGEGVPGTDASLLDPPPPSWGYPGGRGGGEVPGGQVPPIPSERCGVPPEGGGGSGVGYPPG